MVGKYCCLLEADVLVLSSTACRKNLPQDSRYPSKYSKAPLRKKTTQTSTRLVLSVSGFHKVKVCWSVLVAARSNKSAAARLLRLWVQIQPAAWMSVCCVLSGRGLCDELITGPEQSYRLYCVVVCDLETSWVRRPWPTGEGGVAPKKKKSMMPTFRRMKLQVKGNLYVKL